MNHPQCICSNNSISVKLDDFYKEELIKNKILAVQAYDSPIKIQLMLVGEVIRKRGIEPEGLHVKCLPKGARGNEIEKYEIRITQKILDTLFNDSAIEDNELNYPTIMSRGLGNGYDRLSIQYLKQ
jgi:hypothetical protein